MHESWKETRTPNAQKFVTGSVIALLFGGGIASTLDTTHERTLSRYIILGEIHLLSTFLSFTCGMRAGLMHYLGCGIVPRRFYWAPHYMQISSISGVLAAAFASGNADVSPKAVLQILGVCFTMCAGNELLAAKFNMSPLWLRKHIMHSSGATLIGILLLLLSESHTSSKSHRNTTSTTEE
ncbi:putative integral membrane protein [Babesia bovis T2Bo]|uniref:putative integral membrane protein n=1 Tax=Babesia bovis T2Bo TaxID=484906 RepID=UPI001DB2C320|nr:putative integral membrane protein [Babesia bovis T2Bo]EDO05732.2 putative integral membrane protein [Babesia bovis T2Bo]